MRFSHVIKRGISYQFVVRIPVDLLQHFPIKTIWQSLRTSDKRQALVLSAAKEKELQQLFMLLRSGMLPKELEERIIASYLLHGCCMIDSRATDTKYQAPEADLSPVDNVINKSFASRSEIRPGPEDADRKREIFKLNRQRLALRKKAPGPERLTESIASSLVKTGHRLSDKDMNTVALKLTDAENQLLSVQIAALEGDWQPLRQLRADTRAMIAAPYVPFAKVVAEYQAHYESSYMGKNRRTVEGLQSGCRTLLEMIGKASVEEVNSMAMVTMIKGMLRRFPHNRDKHFRGKSLHTIMRSESGYQVIKAPTANRFIGLLHSIMDYALKGKLVIGSNVWAGERFTDKEIPEDKRLPYDKQDLERMTDALCTKSLWVRGEERNERFWLVLLSLFQGLRIGSIVLLTKQHFGTVDGIPTIDLTMSGGAGNKTAATAQLIPVHPALIAIGLLDWVDRLDRAKLFRDTTKQISVWWNRKETASPGFEPRYITTDSRKCLYSTRHTFAGEAYQAAGELKIVSEAMGHATDSRIMTNRYVGRTRLINMSALLESLQMEGVDVQRLRNRAVELFGLPDEGGRVGGI